MKTTLDRNLFTQIGLDSGSLTMLGSIVHSFGEPGEYRGVVHAGEVVKAVFSITSDKNSPAAQATIDLTALAADKEDQGDKQEACCCACPDGSAGGGAQFSVNPRGYALFHVGEGAGGYYVNIRRIDADEKDKGYDSRMLVEGDVFSAIILRPGLYEIRNLLTEAKGEVAVAYPKIGDKAYVPAPPVRVSCGPRSFEPPRLDLQPGQGMLFDAKAPSRIVIKLIKPDDGPGRQTPSGRSGWRKRPLVTR